MIGRRSFIRNHSLGALLRPAWSGPAPNPLDAVRAINFDPAKSGLWTPSNTFADTALTPLDSGDGIGVVLDTLNGAGHEVTLGPELITEPLPHSLQSGGFSQAITFSGYAQITLNVTLEAGVRIRKLFRNLPDTAYTDTGYITTSGLHQWKVPAVDGGLLVRLVESYGGAGGVINSLSVREYTGALTGLGPELAGVSSDDSTGTGTSTHIDGVITIAGTDGGNRGRRSVILTGLTPNQKLYVSAKCTGFSGSQVGLRDETNNHTLTTWTSDGTFTETYTATASEMDFVVRTSSSGGAASMELSIRAIPGNLIQQSSVALQPARQTTPSNIMQFDGTQDYLPIPFDMSNERFVVAMAYHDPSAQTHIVALTGIDAPYNYSLTANSGSGATPLATGATINSIRFDGIESVAVTRGEVWDDLTAAKVMMQDVSMAGGWGSPRVGVHNSAPWASPRNLAALLILQIDQPLTTAENAAVQALMESYL